MKAMLGAVAAVAALSSVLLAPAPAHAFPVYPWCLDYGGRSGGSTNCYFMTWDQCRLSASGNGGLCYRNPFYGARGYGGTDVPEGNTVAPRRRHRSQ